MSRQQQQRHATAWSLRWWQCTAVCVCGKIRREGEWGERPGHSGPKKASKARQGALCRQGTRRCVVCVGVGRYGRADETNKKQREESPACLSLSSMHGMRQCPAPTTGQAGKARVAQAVAARHAQCSDACSREAGF